MPLEALLIAALQQTPGKWLFGVYLQFSISDAYARRDVQAQLRRALRRAFRVWWEGIACGFPVLAPILIAVAYEYVAQNGETDWDFAEDCLVTHSPPGALNLVTGVVGLAAMLWLYGVAWHEPMAESIAEAKAAVISWVPSPPELLPHGLQGSLDRLKSIHRSLAAPAPSASGPITGTASANDVDTAALFAERQARLALLRGEGPRMLNAGNWHRAAEFARPGRTSSSGVPSPGVAWAMRCRPRAFIRTRFTPSARPSNTIQTIAPSTARSRKARKASSSTSSTAIVVSAAGPGR